jgi:hypothetical protein
MGNSSTPSSSSSSIETPPVEPENKEKEEEEAEREKEKRRMKQLKRKINLINILGIKYPNITQVTIFTELKPDEILGLIVFLSNKAIIKANLKINIVVCGWQDTNKKSDIIVKFINFLNNRANDIEIFKGENTACKFEYPIECTDGIIRHLPRRMWYNELVINAIVINSCPPYSLLAALEAGKVTYQDLHDSILIINSGLLYDIILSMEFTVKAIDDMFNAFEDCIYHDISKNQTLIKGELFEYLKYHNELVILYKIIYAWNQHLEDENIRLMTHYPYDDPRSLPCINNERSLENKERLDWLAVGFYIMLVTTLDDDICDIYTENIYLSFNIPLTNDNTSFTFTTMLQNIESSIPPGEICLAQIQYVGKVLNNQFTSSSPLSSPSTPSHSRDT